MRWINWATGSSELYDGQHRIAAIYRLPGTDGEPDQWEALIWGPSSWRKPIWGHRFDAKQSARAEIDYQLSRLAEFARDFLAARNAQS